jgi:hypothetical protein
MLVEATKLASGQDGTYAGVEAEPLARALRRHLGSAIDLLLEHGQHPYHIAAHREGSNGGIAHGGQEKSASPQAKAGNVLLFDGSMGEDLEALGIGMGLAETLGRAEPFE